MKAFLIFALAFLIFGGVAFAHDGQGLVPPCTGSPLPGTAEKICNFCDFAHMGQHLISWMVNISITLGVLFIIWGAFVIMTAGGSPERVSEGRKVMMTAVIGVVIALGAWLILGTIINILGSGSALPWNSIQCG